jgi:hypothetical protein
MAKKQKGGSQKKIGRSKRKAANRGTPISMFTRGKISAEEYFKLTAQTLKRV